MALFLCPFLQCEFHGILWYSSIMRKESRFSIIRTDQIEGGDWQWLRTQSKHPRQLLEVR